MELIFLLLSICYLHTSDGLVQLLLESVDSGSMAMCQVASVSIAMCQSDRVSMAMCQVDNFSMATCQVDN